MSRTLVRNDSAGVAVTRSQNVRTIHELSGNERMAELKRSYSNVKILSPVVKPQTDSAKISAAVDAVMERRGK